MMVTFVAMLATWLVMVVAWSIILFWTEMPHSCWMHLHYILYSHSSSQRIKHNDRSSR